MDRKHKVEKFTGWVADQIYSWLQAKVISYWIGLNGINSDFKLAWYGLGPELDNTIYFLIVKNLKDIRYKNL